MRGQHEHRGSGIPCDKALTARWAQRRGQKLRAPLSAPLVFAAALDVSWLGLAIPHKGHVVVLNVDFAFEGRSLPTGVQVHLRPCRVLMKSSPVDRTSDDRCEPFNE